MRVSNLGRFRTLIEPMGHKNMRAEEFASQLKKLKPSLELLKSKGVSDKAAFEIQKSFDLIERNLAAFVTLPDKDIEELFSRFDPSNVEIGMIRFHTLPQQLSDGWIIGSDEADPLILEASTGEIQVRDLSDRSYKICSCAATGGAFLDAMILAAGYLVDLNHENSDPVIKACAERAGGAQYADFFESLIG